MCSVLRQSTSGDMAVFSAHKHRLVLSLCWGFGELWTESYLGSKAREQQCSSFGGLDVPVMTSNVGPNVGGERVLCTVPVSKSHPCALRGPCSLGARWHCCPFVPAAPACGALALIQPCPRAQGQISTVSQQLEHAASQRLECPVCCPVMS